MPRGGI